MKNMSFSGFMPAHTARTTQQFLVEFRTLMDWPPYLLYLNTLDFSIQRILQVKVQAIPHANEAALRPSRAKEWDRLGAENICRTCCSSRHHLWATVAKNGADIESMGSEDNTNLPFSGL
jgi:hypothetical protein